MLAAILIGTWLITLALGARNENGLRTTSQGVNQARVEDRLVSTGAGLIRTEVQSSESSQGADVLNRTVILVYPGGMTSLTRTEQSKQELIGSEVIARTIVLEGNHNQVRDNSDIEPGLFTRHLI